MFGFLGFNPLGLGLTTKERQRRAELREQMINERLAKAEPWTNKTPWRRHLTLTASSWTPWSLFGVTPTQCADVNNETAPEGKFITSPSGRFLYCEKILPRAGAIALAQGARQGDVMFDGPVRIPSLHERRGEHWNENPWMSVTPMEMMTQRPGTRLARGHVVIAGLGLGFGLFEVLRKRSVKRVTVVEISKELVDWLYPRIMDNIRLRAGEKLPPVEIVVGDAREVLRDFTADVALVDIFRDYGNNTFHVHGTGHPMASPRNIPTVWVWGSATIGERRGFGW